MDIPTKAPPFTLNGLVTKARVVSAYDGDTVKCIFKFKDRQSTFSSYYTWNCRLAGIDTPELRTKNPEEKKAGYKARDALRERILNKVVTLKCYDFDKYGRLLVDILDNDENINQWMIQSGFGKAYDGGTKSKFS